jgi:hypothetical protein
MWKLVSQWHFQLRANSDQKSALKYLNFNEAVLRRIFRSFYLTEKQQPTLEAMHGKMCKSTGYGGGLSSLRLVQRKMGFR